MSAPRAPGRAAAVKRRLTGVAFLGVIVGLVGLTIAFYTKAFVPVVMVELKADKVGNQLSAPADVKLRGLIVGEVRDVTSDGSGATLDLALDPDKVDLIPRNVMARMLPKTLFGEKFVDLVIPPDAVDQPIREGDVIPQDRSETARETEEALNDLLPLLRALRPQDVSVTLNALSSALRGRGDRLGQNLVLVDDYLKQFNPELPTLEQDFRGIADFADTLTQATPDLIPLLDNFSALGRNLVVEEPQLSTFLTTTATSSNELEGILSDNEDRLVRLAADSLPSLQVFSKYSPEFPCLTQGLARSSKVIGDTFGGLQPGLHITVEFGTDQGGYQPDKDEPAYRDDRGPRCYGLPGAEPTAPDINFQDGYNDANGPDTSQDPAASSSNAAVSNPALALSSPAAQRQVMGSVIGPVMGVSSDEVPDLAYLLFGPVARGNEVGLR